MRFHTVLNSEGGTLRTADLTAFSQRVVDTLKEANHEVEVEVVAGRDVVAALERAAASRNVDVLMVGGGDGTVSAAAAALMGKKKALAILPAGTMNLFARSLGIPLALDKAVAAFASGRVTAVDMASANGRPFVHQFSIGMHAQMVHLRSKMEFASRWGKMRATVRAAYATLMNPPTLRVELEFGEMQLLTRTTGIGVTNNLFGEGTLPYANDPAGGTLGIYVTVAEQRSELLRFFAKLARGKWRDNDQVEIHKAEEVRLTIRSKRFQRRCVIDGELAQLERETLLKIHPKALQVLVPDEDGARRTAGETEALPEASLKAGYSASADPGSRPLHRTSRLRTNLSSRAAARRRARPAPANPSAPGAPSLSLAVFEPFAFHHRRMSLCSNKMPGAGDGSSPLSREHLTTGFDRQRQ